MRNLNRKHVLKLFYVILLCISAISIWFINSYFTKLNTLPFPNGSVVVQPHGGTGNQIFQYAAAYSLAKKTNSTLYVLVEKNKNTDNINNLDRNYSLNQFNIPKESIVYLNKISSKFLKMHDEVFLRDSASTLDLKEPKEKISQAFNVTYVDDFNIFALSKMENKQILFMNDHFESEIYFDDMKSDILKIFDLNNIEHQSLQDLITQISDQNAFCVHVRRGDLVQNTRHLMSIE